MEHIKGLLRILIPPFPGSNPCAPASQSLFYKTLSNEGWKSPRGGPIPGLRDGLCVSDLAAEVDFARLSPPANFGVSFSGMHFVARAHHLRESSGRRLRAGEDAWIIDGTSRDAERVTKIQRVNPNAKRWSHQAQGIPLSSILTVKIRGWRPSTMASTMSGAR